MTIAQTIGFFGGVSNGHAFLSLKGEAKKQQYYLLMTPEMGLLYEKGNAKWPHVSKNIYNFCFLHSK